MPLFSFIPHFGDSRITIARNAAQEKQPTLKGSNKPLRVGRCAPSGDGRSLSDY